MGVNSLPKTVTRQRRDCELNLGPSVPESSTLTTRLPSHPKVLYSSSTSTNTQCYNPASKAYSISYTNYTIAKKLARAVTSVDEEHLVVPVVTLEELHRRNFAEPSLIGCHLRRRTMSASGESARDSAAVQTCKCSID